VKKSPGTEPSGAIRRKSEAAHVESRVRTKSIHRSVRGIPFDNPHQSTRAHVGDGGVAMGRGQLEKQHSRLDVDRLWTPSPDQFLTVFQK